MKPLFTKIEVEAFLAGLDMKGWIFLILAFVVVSELVYLTFIKSTKLRKNQSLIGFTIENKFQSLLITFAGTVVVTVVISALPALLLIGGILGIIAIYVGSNYLLAKRFAKRETDKEYNARIREEKERAARELQELKAREKSRDKLFKFKIGERVRIVDTKSCNPSFQNGAVVVIRRRYTPSESADYSNCYKIMGRGSLWREGRFEKLGRGSK